jgi:hypothetical protein
VELRMHKESCISCYDELRVHGKALDDKKATMLLVTYVRVRMKWKWFHLNGKRNEWNYDGFTFPFRDERVFRSNMTIWRYFVTVYYLRSDIGRYIDIYHWYDVLITLSISGVDGMIDMIYLYFDSTKRREYAIRKILDYLKSIELTNG